MADTEIEKAFGKLADAFTVTENQLNHELGTAQQQIEQLKQHIASLNGKQQTLVHDRDAISAMYKRYCNTDNGKAEF